MSIFAVIFQLAENAVDSGGDVFDLISDVDPTAEDGDIGMGDSTGVSVSLDGEIFLEEKKYQESNIGDSDNTRDGGKIVAGIEQMPGFNSIVRAFASLGHDLECSSCGTLYTRDCGCSKSNVEDKILVPKPPKNYARCTRCGYLVDGPNCQGCALLRQELEKNLESHSPDFQHTSEPSNASTNVVNAPREPYVVKQDNRSFVDKIIFDLNRAPDSPHLHTISPNQFHCFHCKDVLRDGEACKRCTCAKCGSGLGKGLCYICGNNQNSLNDSPSISETSSQSPPNINHCCYECGDPLDDIFCKRCTPLYGFSPCRWCTCERCGIDMINGICPLCHLSNSCVNDHNPNSFDYPSDSYHPPHPTYETYSGDTCGNDSQFGYDCPPQFPLNYEPEPGYIQNYNSYPHDSLSFPQQYPCCEDCGVTHEPYQCQPPNHDYYHKENSCYDSNSIGFDQSQPQQYTVNHPIFSAHHDLLGSQKTLNMTLTTQEEKRIEEEQAAKAQSWKFPVCYDDDDDEEGYNSLNDNIISELPSYSAVTTQSDEVIKSCVENLVPNPSESEGKNECDVLADFTTFSNVLFDDDYDSDSSDDQN
uniref:Pre-mRNA splicing Prp18-interacting factor n=1 Tax=Tanacetum cinerariifolium TaxID=118510 RepID=A0A6L2J350_TANCI|nr:hypothetical protein [Tanacetum cinerariifolium]